MKTSLPPFELLEKTHTFPGPYLFKIIGKADPGFVARVVAVVREELTVEADPPYRIREAVGGRHLSVTVEPMVQSAHQVLAIYRRLKILDGLGDDILTDDLRVCRGRVDSVKVATVRERLLQALTQRSLTVAALKSTLLNRL